MKTLSLFHVAVLAGAFLILSGCSKQEAPATGSTSTTAGSQPSAVLSEAVDAAKKSAQDAAAEVQKQAGQIKESADAAIADAKKEAERIKQEAVKSTEVTPPAVPTPPAPGAGAAASGQSQVTAVLAQAKTLYTEKKYPEALAALGGLQNVTLTAEEQNMVAQLKTQISNALASQGANEGLKSVGGLLQPKQ